MVQSSGDIAIGSMSCACFETCSRSTLDAFLKHVLPPRVASRSSPWFAMLRTIYGEAVSLPFDLNRLRILYHADELWRSRSPGVLWPMATCVDRDHPLRQPTSWQPLRVASPPCSASTCTPWLPEWLMQQQPEQERRHDRFNLTHATAQLMARSGRGAPVVMNYRYWAGLRRAQPSHVHTGAVRWTQRNESVSVTYPWHPDGTWVEVMRFDSGVKWMEGVRGYGTWFDMAPGSGIFVNVGRSARGHGERELLNGAFMEEWLAAHRLAAANRSTFVWKRGGHFFSHKVTIPREAVALLEGVSWIEPYPFMAYELGYDSVQVSSTAGYGVSPQLIVTSRESVVNASCVCEGCDLRQLAMRCSPFGKSRSASVCGWAIEYRVGWNASQVCECRRDIPTMLTCTRSDQRPTGDDQPTLGSQEGFDQDGRRLSPPPTPPRSSELKPAATLSSAPLSAPDSLAASRIAVCLAGAARSLTNPEVSGAARRHLLEALRESAGVESVVLFMHVKKQDVRGALKQKRKASPTPSDAKLFEALALLDPAVIEIGDEMQAYRRRLRCPLRTLEGVRTISDEIAGVNQLFMSHRCFQMIERYEETQPAPFTHVIRTRPDLMWSVNASAPSRWPAQGARYHDWAYLLPRSRASVILEAPFRMAEECRDPLVQTFAVDAALWAYRIMDRTQLDANMSAPVLYFQDKWNHRALPALRRNGEDTLSEQECRALFPMTIARAAHTNQTP